jgi:hypothetical protein
MVVLLNGKTFEAPLPQKQREGSGLNS